MSLPALPKVTVIIPNYNHARFLEKRIESVLNQTYQDFEVLYLDDASTDQSDQVFSSYANNSRIRAVINQQNSGSAFKQWNKGVQEARGQYIWIAESDDYADKHLLETLVALLDNLPNVGIAFCDSQTVDENDQIIDLPSLSPYDCDPMCKQNFVMPGKEYLQRYMLHANTIPNASAVVFRKAVYQEAGGAHQKLRLAGDWITWIAILKRCDIAYVAQPMNFFRAHATTVRNRSVKAGLWAEERYRVSRLIARNLVLPDEELEKMRHKCMENWQYAIYDSETRIGWQRGQRIFRLARRFDRHVMLRFLRHTVYRGLHQTPVFEVARSAGRALWRALAPSKA